jgi:hypothetical protein
MPLVELLIGGQTKLAQGQDVVLANMTLTSGLIDDLFAGRMTQIFLKQFRDTADGTRACYQAVVEAPIQIKRISYALTERDWSFTLHPLDSHPIDHELGVASQPAAIALDMQIDFLLENGVEVGRVTAPAAPVTRLPSPPHNGPLGVVESTLRWAWHELTKRI